MTYYKINKVGIYHDASRRHEPYYAEVVVDVYARHYDWWETQSPDSTKIINVHLNGSGLSKAESKIRSKLLLEGIVNRDKMVPNFTCQPCVERYS